MKARLLLSVLFVFSMNVLSAQTWLGVVSPDWNDSANWSNGIRPSINNNVVINSVASTNYSPLLTGNVNVNSITVNNGASIDFNGYQIQVADRFNFVGPNIHIYNSADSSSNISITINGSTNHSVWGGIIAHDTVELILNGNEDFYESYSGTDTFKYDFKITLNGSGGITTSYFQPIYTFGNLKIDRTTAGTNLLFKEGGVVGNDFTFHNLKGGLSTLGNVNKQTLINGKVNIDYEGENNFRIRKLKNITNGGNVSINNTVGLCQIHDDTLVVSNFNYTNYSGNNSSEYFDMLKNSITGNFTFSDSSTNNNTIYFSNNFIKGDMNIIKNGDGKLEESYSAMDSIVGNFSLTINSECIANTSTGFAQYVSGNYSVDRTVSGNTYLFKKSGTVGGHFSYTNTKGGVSHIGHNVGGPNATGNRTRIGGKLDINIQKSLEFKLYKVRNDASGGVLSVNHAQGQCELYFDTLNVTALKFNNYSGGTFFELMQSSIKGDFLFSDSSANNAPCYFVQNLIEGNTEIVRYGKGDFFDSYYASNHYEGNVVFENNNSIGKFYLNYNKPTYFYKNLTLQGRFNFDLRLNKQLNFVGSSNGVFEFKKGTEIELGILNLDKSNNATLRLKTPISISDSLNFFNGDLITTDTSIVRFLAGSAHALASDKSKVLGPVSKVGNSSFYFPIGVSGKYMPIWMSAPSIAIDEFKAECFHANPTSRGLDTALKTGSLKMINGLSYFRLDRERGNSSVTIGVGYNFPQNMISNANDLRITYWDGNEWDDLGNASVTGNTLAGLVFTSGSINKFGYFNIGTVDAFNTVLIADWNQPVCEGGTLQLTSSTSPSGNYSWTGPNGFTSSLQNPSIQNVSLAASGDYKVLSTVGSSIIEGTVNVSISPIPKVSGINVENRANGYYYFEGINVKGAEKYLWNFGDGNYSSEATPTHAYNQRGKYQVALMISSDCGADTIYFEREFVQLSIDEKVEEKNQKPLLVFPNPTKGSIILKSNSSHNLKLCLLFDITGRLIDKIVLNNEEKVQMNFQNHSSGTYFIKVLMANDQWITERVIIE